VLNHLGINLYSNVPAVLSEVVANAWDANAHEVTIDIDKGKDQIVIKDDGIGMTEEDINRRYLNVGYRKRSELPGKTPEGREPMGRKGIGKLSVFSVARTIEVHSTKDGERHAFRMNSDDIQRAIEDPHVEDDYYPEELDPSLVDFDKGTKIVLKDL
jgi:HSP90 family molecular chaperone